MGVESANGLVPYGGAMMLTGLVLGLAATWVEVQRKSKAEALAMDYAPKGDGRWQCDQFPPALSSSSLTA